MVNEDILGGIEIGTAKGDHIESIMMSFFNAGYPREDIEWAAKAFQLNEFKGGPAGDSFNLSSGIVPQKSKLSSFFKPKIEAPATQFAKKPYVVKQNVSSYEQASQFKERIILIVLVSSLILLLGILAGVFLFKEQLVGFINNLFAA